MAFQERDFSFGDFETLSQEEQDRVYHILHGPKESLVTKVEFPWDDCADISDFRHEYGGPDQTSTWVDEQYQGPFDRTCFTVSGSDPIMQNPNCYNLEFQASTADNILVGSQPPSDIQFSSGDSGIIMCGPTDETVATGTPQSYQPKMYDDQEILDDSGVVDMESSSYEVENKSRLQASMRSLERRNKKKRPADYYKRFEGSRDPRDDGELTEVVVDKNFSGSQSSSSYREGSVDSSHEGQSDYFHNTDVPSEVTVPHSDMFFSTDTCSAELDIRRDEETYQQSGQRQQQYAPQTDQVHFQHGIHTYVQSDRKDIYSDDSNYNVQNSASSVSETCTNYGNSSQEFTESSQRANSTNYEEMEESPSAEQDSKSQFIPQDSYKEASQNELTAGVENLTLSQELNRSTCNSHSADTKQSSIEYTYNSEEKSEFSNSNSEGELNANKTSGPEPEKPKTSSWAGLFKSTPTAAKSIVVYCNQNTSSVAPVELEDKTETMEPEPIQKPVSASEDNVARQLGELLSTCTLLHKPVALQPRGLVNKGNWCYINATLQALIACPPFYNLLKKLPSLPARQRGPSSTPILDSLVEFVHEFSPMHRADKSSLKNKTPTPEIQPGTHFEPSYVYKMLQVIADNPAFKLGKQEDAEEFLSCILNGIHEEMSASMKLICDKKDLPEDEQPIANGFVHEVDDKEENQSEDEDSWEQVGPKRKSVLTRKADFADSPIADIFTGYIRSAVFKVSSKESANLQPFFTLQLDIQSEKVWTVKDALEGLVSREAVGGYTCSKTNTELEVSRKITLEQLPPVLILHLKCFVYDKDGGCQKLMKKVDYSVELEITKDLLSPTVRSKLNTKQRSYKLFAVVYHHGKNATGGHYTTSSYHPGINGWIHIDDSIVKTANLQHVMKYSPPRVPYLLYYRRVDIH